MSRIHRQRREHREDLLLEVAVHRLAFAILEAAVETQVDADGRQPRAQLVKQQRACGGVELPHARIDKVQLLGGGEAVRRRLEHAGRELPPEARHADHVELVKV